MANWATTALLGDPRDPEWQRKNLQEIEPVAGQRWNVYGPAATAFTGLIKDLAAEGYPVQSSGGFNYRNIAGSEKLSQHAFGTAIDVNAATNPRGGSSDLPADVAQLAGKYGLEWGGLWKNPDPMHFEYRGPSAYSTGGQNAPLANPSSPSFLDITQPRLAPTPTPTIGEDTTSVLPQQTNRSWMDYLMPAPQASTITDPWSRLFAAQNPFGDNPLRPMVYNAIHSMFS